MKNKTVKKEKNKINIIETKTIDKRGYPIPKSEICFRCGEKFWLTFVFSRKNYSLKNSWFIYTERNEDLNTYICSPCLREIYLENVKNLSKKRLLSSYVSTNSV